MQTRVATVCLVTRAPPFMPCMKLLWQPALVEEALHDAGKLGYIGRKYTANVLLQHLWSHVTSSMRGKKLL